MCRGDRVLMLLAAACAPCPPDGDAGAFRSPSTSTWVMASVGVRATCAIDLGGDVGCWGTADEASGSTHIFTDAPRGRYGWIGMEHVGDGTEEELACAGSGPTGVSCWGRITHLETGDLALLPAGGVACGVRSQTGLLTCSTITGTVPDFSGGFVVQDWDFGPGLLATVDDADDPGTLGVQLHEWDVPPTAVPDGTWTRVAQGGKSGALCAIRDSGSLHCWRAVEGPDLAIADPPDGEYDDVCLFTGLDAACALDTDGRATCWGDDAPESPSRRYAALSCGHTSVCGQLEDGRLQCWGACEHGECDVPE